MIDEYPSRVTSVVDYVDAILELRGRWAPQNPNSELWYRGVNDDALMLQPGAYWREECDEVSLVASFRALSPPLLPREPADDWEWYYLMQHYGLPTRLLDWTEAPLAALYFALDGSARALETDDEPRKAVPCVWILDPLALNRNAGLDHIPVPRVTGPTRRWLPRHCGRGRPPRTFKKTKHMSMKSNASPLAIYPTRHNPRIVAQRGVFTVHGTDETPIEALAVTSEDGSQPRLGRIRIDPEYRETVRDELWVLGINKTAIYPEPQSLADDLRRLYETE